MSKPKISFLFIIFLTLILIIVAQTMHSTHVPKFNRDGTFRILQINDFQDTDKTNEKSLLFLNTLLDKYKPDLVVIVGDQLSDVFEDPTSAKIKTAIRNQLQPLENQNIPFLFTFGNHDRDYEDILTIEEQAEVYHEFTTCLNAKTPYPGTTNLVIYDHKGLKPKLNIYMMDTHDWNKSGANTGINRNQLHWYQTISNSLKLINHGEPLPSLIFQHIPVKEIYSLLEKVSPYSPDSVKCPFSDDWYILDKNVHWVGDFNVMKEAPSSENFSTHTHQYESWLKQGDIIGAYFGHDHFNSFVGETKDGIILGYNPSFGFATYGDDEERYARIFDFNEKNIMNYTQTTISYSECMSK